MTGSWSGNAGMGIISSRVGAIGATTGLPRCWTRATTCTTNVDNGATIITITNSVITLYQTGNKTRCIMANSH